MISNKGENMRKIVFLIILALITSFSSFNDIVLKKVSFYKSNDIKNVKNELIIKLKKNESDLKRINPEFKAMNLEKTFINKVFSVEYDKNTGYLIAKTREDVNLEELKQELIRRNDIEDVSLNYYAHITSVYPNDKYFQYQYYLNNTGQVYYPDKNLKGKNGADVKVLDAWDWSKGDDVIVAVVDSGVFSSHEDIEGKVLQGYNFVSLNYNTEDDNGHGTFVSSIIAANTENLKGISGIGWNTKILPVKVTDKDGNASYLTVAAGIRFAADNGAKVINLSLGGEYKSFILEDACEYAFNKGCVLVCSSGNTGTAVFYPAAYDDYCIAVGASNANDEVVQWSNHGKELDVVAPGDYIFGAYFDTQNPDKKTLYAWGSGTSFSAPIVSGEIALLLSIKPFLTNIDVVNLIKYTADDINGDRFPGIDEYAGYGRVNFEKLLAPYEFE